MSSPAGYDALLAGNAFVRRSDRGVLRVRGTDRAVWLQGLLTNDVLKLAPGERVYSAWLTPQGRMITDAWVVATSDSLLLDVPASLATSLAARLDGLVFAEDVQIDDVSGETVVLQMFGDRPSLVGEAVVVPDETYGVPGFAVYVAPGELDAVVSGSSAHVEVSLDVLEVLRVEAGVPRFFADMGEDTIPLEAGIEGRAISFTKGCYVGQEIIVRVTTRGGGRVARRLVGLDFAAAEPPPSGASLHAAGKTVGRVTTAVFSPRRAAVIGLGYVHRDEAEAGTRLVVHADDRQLDATVRPLPFLPALA